MSASLSSSSHKHDIFISYSHGNPEGVAVTGMKNWVEGFVERLKNACWADGEVEDFKVWFDHQIDRNKPLKLALEETVKNSAILMIVMSRPYLRSGWCFQELSWFQETPSQTEHPFDRIFLIHFNHTDEDKWPTLLKDGDSRAIGYHFFEEGNRDQPTAFGWEKPQPDDKLFIHSLNRLIPPLLTRIKQIRQEVAIRVEEQARGERVDDGPATLYLHASPDDPGIWHTVRKTLEESQEFEGYRLLPATAPALVDIRSLKAVREDQRRRVRDMAECHAVLVLRSTDNPEIDDEIELISEDLKDVAERHDRQPRLALLDFDGRPPALLRDLAIRHQPATNEDWPVDLKAWLTRITT